ncbi:MAG: hypothetical protein PHU51_02310, partial [Candidatus Nanoarchaeia archaeon]|nr:hypothetical protein [Candidatus Nanoarchaeia archaeon]
VPGKDGQNRRYTVWKNDDGDYTGDFEDWAVDTVFVPTSNEQDKKRIADLEKQIGQNIKTIIPKKIKVPGKNGKWMYVRNIFLTGNNEYQGQLEGLIPDTLKVEVPGKDGQNRRYTVWKNDDGDYTGDFEDLTVDTVYVAKKDPEDEKKINNLEGQLAYWKNIKSKTKTDTLKVEVPGKDGQNRRYTVWKNDDGDYTGDFEDWAVDTVFVPTSNEAMNDSLNYWKSLYRNKKGDVYKNQINLKGLNLKLNPNTKIYKSNGGK